MTDTRESPAPSRAPLEQREEVSAQLAELEYQLREDPSPKRRRATVLECAAAIRAAYPDEWAAALAPVESETPEMRRALERCREAVASLPIDALGEGSTTCTTPDGEAGLITWPLRDELLSEIDRALPPAAESETPEMRRALERCREAVASLPIDALGEGSTTCTTPDGEAGLITWPLRDELLSEIDRALAPTPASGPVEVSCVSCEDDPKAPNNPCASCGRSAASGRAEALEAEIDYLDNIARRLNGQDQADLFGSIDRLRALLHPDTEKEG